MNNALDHEGRQSPAPGELSLVNCPTQAALLDDLSQCMQERRGFSVATLNLDHIVKMRSDPVFRDAYHRHSHVVADGNPIVWLSRLAGHQIDLVPGSELIVPLAALAAELNVPVAMLGSTQETLDAAATALNRQFPALRIVARIAPPQGFDPAGGMAADALAQIGGSGAGLCFIALGAPKQEVFAIVRGHALPGCGFVSIGAGLDFIAGTQVRAPRWVRRIAMEWLWRMLSNPKRLARRYWGCIVILPDLALRSLAARRLAASDSAGQL